MITKNLKSKINPMLMKVIIISVIVHIVAGFIAGVVTIATNVIKEDAQFEEPPVMEEQEPPKEVKIEIKPPPQQNQPMQKLSLRNIGNIAVAEVDVNLPSMSDSFTVSGGVGNLSGGSLLGGSRGGIDFGMSSVNVFGLKTKAERILFVIDVGRQMLTDAKGGVGSYRVIKDEITNMVGNLSAGTLFNVMLHDRRRVMLFKKKLVSAGEEVHNDLVKWLRPINADASSPGFEGNYPAKVPGLKTLPNEMVHDTITSTGFQGNETGFLTQFAVEQGVDAIFHIAGYHKGFERLRRNMTPEEEADWQKVISQPKYQKQLAEHELEVPKMQQRVNARLAEINRERRAKGQAIRVLDQRHGVYTQANELGLKWNVPHPGWRPYPFVTPRESAQYFKKVNEELYGQFDKTPPSVNVVLFLAEDEPMTKQEEKQLNDFTRFFKGKYRIIRGGKAIRQAATAATTTQ
ncbi:MAG: hypothetical protein ACON39_00230 [Coraliomargaritaceae bacterium]